MDTKSPGSLQVVDGTYYNPLDYRPEDVKIDIIAHQLSLKCRWNGNTNCFYTGEPLFYSVAQHSCIVHDLARDYKDVFVPGARWDLSPCPSAYGLMHDAAEAPYIDVPRPLKREFPLLAEIEKPIIATILQTLNIPMDGMVEECVRRIDNAMIFWERDLLVGTPVEPYSNESEHPGGSLLDWFPSFRVWDPAQAKVEFLDRFHALDLA